MTHDDRPSVFVASSTEAIEIAQAIQRELAHTCRVHIWNQDIFLPGGYTIDSLTEAANDFDFGIFVFAPDDRIESRGNIQVAPRDNVLFECGLFFSTLGRQCSFFVLPKGGENVRVPSDLWGVIPAKYDAELVKTGDHQAAVGAACSQIQKAMNRSRHRDHPMSSLGGEWTQTWTMDGSTSFPGENTAPAVVRHIGDRFFATCHANQHPFSVKGVIENGRFITGTWGQAGRGGFYFGAFQLCIHPKAHRMDGRVVGFRSDNSIGQGTWRWERTESV